MSTADQGSLSQLASDIQKQSQQFQQQFTEAASQVKSKPKEALMELERLWNEADKLENDHLNFLEQMDEFGSQQTPITKDTWRQIRLDILAWKAQALFIIGEYKKAQSNVDIARKSFITDPSHPTALWLDELECDIAQAEA